MGQYRRPFDERQHRNLRAFAKRGGHKIVEVFMEMALGVGDGIVIGMHPVREEVLRWSQTRSTGLSSGEYTDSGTGVMVSGTVRSPAPCQPA
jgi:hypothetical protein